jgi:hypothetical protein
MVKRYGQGRQIGESGVGRVLKDEADVVGRTRSIPQLNIKAWEIDLAE